MEAPLLSLVVNTFNAERDLESALRSAEGVADELVVVDMHSEDGTREIAAKFGARIFLHPRTGYVEPARNFAIAQARGTWILVLDADERLDDALRRGLRSLLTCGPNADAFSIVRRNYAAGRWLRGTGWGPDREQHVRLFRRGSVEWPDQIHARPKVSGRVESLPLLGAAIEHLNFRELRDFVARLDKYTEQEMRLLADSGVRWTPQRMLGDSIEELRSRYQPHLDGVHSLVFASFVAFYRFLSWARLWEREGYPDAPLPRDAEALFHELARLAHRAAPAAGVSVVSGGWDDEGSWRWLQRRAVLRVEPDRLAEPTRLRLTFRGPPAGAVAFPLVVSVRFGAKAPFDLRLGPEASEAVELTLPASTSPLEIEVECSAAFVPERMGLGSDGRELAVRLLGVEWCAPGVADPGRASPT